MAERSVDALVVTQLISGISSNLRTVKDAYHFFENVRNLSNTNQNFSDIIADLYPEFFLIDVDFSELVSVVITMIGRNLVALNFIRRWASMNDSDRNLEIYEEIIDECRHPEPAIMLLIEIFHLITGGHHYDLDHTFLELARIQKRVLQKTYEFEIDWDTLENLYARHQLIMHFVEQRVPHHMNEFVRQVDNRVNFKIDVVRINNFVNCMSACLSLYIAAVKNNTQKKLFMLTFNVGQEPMIFVSLKVVGDAFILDVVYMFSDLPAPEFMLPTSDKKARFLIMDYILGHVSLIVPHCSLQIRGSSEYSEILDEYNETVI